MSDGQWYRARVARNTPAGPAVRMQRDGPRRPSREARTPTPAGPCSGITVVPDEHDRAAELLVCGDQQVPVVAPGEALAAVAAAVIPARPGIERMLGFTIIERTRPLTATDPGQVLLARNELLMRSL